MLGQFQPFKPNHTMTHDKSNICVLGLDFKRKPKVHSYDNLNLVGFISRLRPMKNNEFHRYKLGCVELFDRFICPKTALFQFLTN